MCGIYALNNSLDLSTVEKVHAHLARRGPDNQSRIELSNRYTLGHSLLQIHSSSIQDSVQPLYSSDRRITVVVNGEVYNYAELRHDLQCSGYVFSTDSDCEVFAHGLHRDGIDYIAHIDGEFCYVAYDIVDGVWMCGVDRWGTKPLKYLISDDVVAFASDNATLQLLLGRKFKIDNTSVSQVLGTGVLDVDRTLYSGVNKIRPGHNILIDNATKTVRMYDYRPQITPYRTTPCIDTIEEYLENSILRRWSSKHKIAVALSGGIDSAMIAYYLKKHRLDYTAYTIDWVSSHYTEVSDVLAFSRQHDVDLKILPIDRRDIADAFVEAVLHSENIVINPHCSGKLLLNKHMKLCGHRICYTGDGADELFWGYDHFHTSDKYQFITNSEATSSKLNSICSPEWRDSSWIRSLSLASDARQLYCDHWLSEYGLKILGDSQSYNIGQEHRYPFLDRGLWDYCTSIVNWRELNSPSKAVLRSVASRWDNTAASIAKRPFIAPFIDSTWRTLIEKYIYDSDALNSLGIFNTAAIKEWFSTLLQTNITPSSVITSQLLSLAILTCHQSD